MVQVDRVKYWYGDVLMLKCCWKIDIYAHHTCAHYIERPMF